jgi:hypothetical protein
VLRKVLTGLIVVTPHEDEAGRRWFSYRAPGTYQRVLAGVIGIRGVEDDEQFTVVRGRGVPADDLDSEVKAVVRRSAETSGTSMSCEQGVSFCPSATGAWSRSRH